MGSVYSKFVKFRHPSHVFLEGQSGDEINSKLISSGCFRILLEAISHFVVLPQQGLTLQEEGLRAWNTYRALLGYLLWSKSFVAWLFLAFMRPSCGRVVEMHQRMHTQQRMAAWTDESPSSNRHK